MIASSFYNRFNHPEHLAFMSIWTKTVMRVRQDDGLVYEAIEDYEIYVKDVNGFLNHYLEANLIFLGQENYDKVLAEMSVIGLDNPANWIVYNPISWYPNEYQYAMSDEMFLRFCSILEPFDRGLSMVQRIEFGKNMSMPEIEQALLDKEYIAKLILGQRYGLQTDNLDVLIEKLEQDGVYNKKAWLTRIFVYFENTTFDKWVQSNLLGF